MRVTIISAAGIVGAFIFQGCKTEAGTRALETADKFIQSYEDLIKTSHSKQQCHDLRDEFFAKIEMIEHDTNGRAYQNQITKLKEKSEQIGSLYAECVKTATVSQVDKLADPQKKSIDDLNPMAQQENHSDQESTFNESSGDHTGQALGGVSKDQRAARLKRFQKP